MPACRCLRAYICVCITHVCCLLLCASHSLAPALVNDRMNLHIMRMEKGSRLMQRALKLATSLPLNHPDFENTIINKLCKPNGYYQVCWCWDCVW